MATPPQLVEEGDLIKVGSPLGLGEMPERAIYAFPRAVEWMQEHLTELQSDGYYTGVVSPLEQADDLLHRFIIGDDMQDKPPRSMRPEREGVWELRTPDLRFFGWFWKRGCFLLSAIATKKECKISGLYHGYMQQCVRDRTLLNLDSPKFRPGGYDEVF